MNDLVERLRKTQELYEQAGVDGSEGALQAREAADRITALEAERDEWIKIVGQIAGAVPVPEVLIATGSVGDLIDYFKGLRAERDMLREASETIAQTKPHHSGQTPNEYHFQQIARAALAGGK